MRRGFISRSLIETPDAAYAARLDRLRLLMHETQLDALMIYTNNSRTAGASWLTGFIPYWSDGLLVVPRSGEPTLTVALSFRSKPWIERTSRVTEVILKPRIGFEAAQLIAKGHANAAVGIVDYDNLPAGVADELREGGPRLTFSDASDLFSTLRMVADPTETALAAKAASIASDALGEIPPNTTSSSKILAAVEYKARWLGAEEVYLAVAPDLAVDRRLIRIDGERSLGRTFAVRATVAYKGTWVRIVRTIDHDATTSQINTASARFAQAVAQLPEHNGLSAFKTWLVEGSRLAQPLDPLIGSRVTSPFKVPAGALVSVQAEVTVDDRVMLLGAPALTGRSGESAGLLHAPAWLNSL